MNSEHVEELGAYFVEKSELKQIVYRKTLECFEIIKQEGVSVVEALRKEQEKKSSELELAFSPFGSYEAELRFAGDAISLQMHTNVFAFPEDHFVRKSQTVKKDANAGYFGMILIYNFLADSLRYNRYADVGYLLGRIFINKDGKFFVEGRRQLNFLYKDFDKQEFNAESACEIIQKSMKQAIDFDLFVPPFDSVKEVTLQQKIVQQGNTAIKTGKRLGFVYDSRDGLG